MSAFDDHPTVRRVRAIAAEREPSPPQSVDSEQLRALALESGADDCGFVSVSDPALDIDREHVLRCFPRTRTLLALVKRMHREPIRSPDRSVANLEFHRAGDDIDDVARAIVRRLEDRGIAAVNPPMAFPMEMESFPERGWIVSHKIVAQAAGLGAMGIHRSLIHPKFGSFILLGTVLIDIDLDRPSVPLDYNPCVGCNLCVSVCPVGAIKPDGAFDFMSCYTHNYQQFMSGFANWVEDVAASRSAADYGSRVSYSETAMRWQSLSYGPNYNSAYCLAVCPAGENVLGRYAVDRKAFTNDVVRPLQQKVEPIYVARESDAASHVARRFPHKRVRYVRSSGRATSVKNFLGGMPLSFAPGKSKGLNATFHFLFTGSEEVKATVTIRDRKLGVTKGHEGSAQLTVVADSRAWIRFLNHEASIFWFLLTRKIKLRGSPRLLAAFGRCFPP